MKDKEFLDQIDALLAEFKQEVYARAGWLTASGAVKLREIPSGDHTVTKAVLLTTADWYFRRVLEEHPVLVRRLAQVRWNPQRRPS